MIHDRVLEGSPASQCDYTKACVCACVYPFSNTKTNYTLPLILVIAAELVRFQIYAALYRELSSAVQVREDQHRISSGQHNKQVDTHAWSKQLRSWPLVHDHTAFSAPMCTKQNDRRISPGVGQDDCEPHLLSNTICSSLSISRPPFIINPPTETPKNI